MNLQSDRETADVGRKHPRRSKAVGQGCVGLFILLMITLMQFGRPPFREIAVETGARPAINYFSCLGIAGGVFAIVFLLMSLQQIRALGPIRKVLGLVGGAGLILHTILALLALVL